MSKKTPPGIMLYPDFWHGLKRLSAEEKGRLVDAMVEYAETESAPEFDGVLALAWDMAKAHVDNDAARYAAKCKKNRENANARWGNAADATECDGMRTHTNDANTTQLQHSTTQKEKINKKESGETNHRFVPTGEFEGYWEDFIDGKWVRVD